MLLETLSLRTRVPIVDLEAIAASASKRYKVYPIEKRNGGVRWISHPSRTLKVIQRWIVRNVLSVAPVHPSATAYEKGSNILENASRHAGTNFTTRIDFKDFFPAFDSESVHGFLRNLVEKDLVVLNQRDLLFAVRILCKDGKLTIGAPSSPKISNAMMFEFDKKVSSVGIDEKFTYTRYADDIFISGFTRESVICGEECVRELVKTFDRPRLEINEGKSLHLSRRNHRSVTGLVLTPDGRVSLGREKKREMKSLVHQAQHNRLNPVDRARLAGLIAFSHSVEPSFLGVLSRKYEIDVLTWAKSL